MEPIITNAENSSDTLNRKAATIRGHLRDILSYIGDDPSREGLFETPKRIIESWKTLFAGYKMVADEILRTGFAEHGNYNEMIVLRDIDFFSVCEHHFLPIYGKAHIAYIPSPTETRVVGISKLARLVEMHARRLQIQERLTTDIANDIDRCLKPAGVGVLIEGQHFCIQARGVQKINSVMVTSKLVGVFERPEVRAEFLRLIGRGQ